MGEEAHPAHREGDQRKAGLGVNADERRRARAHADSAAHRRAPQGVLKIVKRKGEEHKVAIRNERRDANELLRSTVKEGDLTEDDGKKTQEKVQLEVDSGIKKVDEIIANKEKDLMQV